MKLNWFSPLPPTRTAIADYTAEIVPHLYEIGEVRLWTDQAAWDKNIENVAEVRHISPAVVGSDKTAGAINVYNIGNDARFHGRIWQASRAQPGIVILHDTNLRQFEIYTAIRIQKQEEHIAELTRRLDELTTAKQESKSRKG